MCSDNEKCVKLGQIWMTKDGQRVEIVCLHGGQHYWAFRFEWLDYLISKE